MKTVYQIIKSAQTLYELSPQPNIVSLRESPAPERVLSDLLNSTQYKQNYCVEMIHGGKKVEDIALELTTERKNYFSLNKPQKNNFKEKVVDLTQLIDSAYRLNITEPEIMHRPLLLGLGVSTVAGLLSGFMDYTPLQSIEQLVIKSLGLGISIGAVTSLFAYSICQPLPEMWEEIKYIDTFLEKRSIQKGGD